MYWYRTAQLDDLDRVARPQRDGKSSVDNRETTSRGPEPTHRHPISCFRDTSSIRLSPSPLSGIRPEYVNAALSRISFPSLSQVYTYRESQVWRIFGYLFKCFQVDNWRHKTSMKLNLLSKVLKNKHTVNYYSRITVLRR